MKLSDPITKLQDIGKIKQSYFNQAEIYTIKDLVEYIPRSWQKIPTLKPIIELRPGQVAFCGTVEELESRYSHGGKKILTATVLDSSGSIKVVWFNMEYLEKYFKPDRIYYFLGQLQYDKGYISVTNPHYSDNPGKLDLGKLRPVYKATSKLKSSMISNAVSQLDFDRLDFDSAITDHITKSSNTTNISLTQAFELFHRPKTLEQLSLAKTRLAWEEVIWLLLAAQLTKEDNQQLNQICYNCSSQDLANFISNLSFKLTADQSRTIKEVISDFQAKYLMNRLCQGDVGTGKTIIGIIASYAMIQSGYQVAMIAPTTVLAKQHYLNAKQHLPNSIKIALLSSETNAKDKQVIYQDLASQKLDFVIGTHAIFNPKLKFSKLGLVILDEQQRFGVEQRLTLKKISKTTPHYLSLTATPIPRSLSLTVFADLDNSILKQKPLSGQMIETEIYDYTMRRKVLKQIKSRLSNNQQAYIVSSRRVNPSQNSLSAKQLFEEIEFNKLLGDKTLGYLDGSQPEASKQETLARFQAGEIDVLVATSVIEVGIDNPNATTIMIESANDFGLSSLHQLRGRVGRGSLASKCFLINTSDQIVAKQRLESLSKTQDGFKLAELDLKLRGPGQILGYEQTGKINLKIVKAFDTKLIYQIKDAIKPFINSPGWKAKIPAEELRKFYQSVEYLD
ncbi:ATP-dependent DNA helicase RecG [Candidatus Saccharibacteria bacterium]|nr:ATP-dependent DNA helicase RecG [Candidatus Saccharibacteria bacterium]MCB9834857.1 ATP-dependent DNA helicase RecG [Candidatus Nomurabacteria bacterium]